MKLDHLKDLYLQELKDIYSAESQILKALPKMADAASSPQLKESFQLHLEQTKNQIERLNKIFESLGVAIKSKKCEGMEGIIEEGSEVLEMKGDPTVKDAALIACAQKVEHYEISSYGTVRTFAKMLGEQQAASLLDETLAEEKETDKLLTKMAEKGINKSALAA
jgi:ferritin-like metal-binding protein YciE